MSTILLRRVAAIVCLVSWLSAATKANEPINIGTRRELFVDDHLVDKIEGDAQLKLQQPVAREVSMVTDKPWEGNTCGYFTVFSDKDAAGDEIIRMYYRGAGYDIKTKRPMHRQLTCYAESKDGIHWTRPNLGLVEFNGSKANNIIWDGAGSNSFTPFKDTNPNCPADARYKALGQVHKSGKANYGVQGEMTVFAFKSADGLRWKISDGPLITRGDFDSQNTAFWDAHAGLYREYHRVRFYKPPNGKLIIGGQAARPGYRSIMTGTSKNFLNWTSWSEPQLLKFDDDIGPQELYTNAVIPCPRAPHILIGFPTRLRRDGSNITEPLLMVSRNGHTFKRWREPVVPKDAPKDRDGYKSNYMGWGLVPTPGNNREYSMYAVENYISSTPTRLRRFTYRVDGFVALRGGKKGGRLTTRPLTVNGGHLEINYVARAGGHVRVGILHADGRPLANFSTDQCDSLTGDEISKKVTWKTDGNGPFGSQPVRVRFEVKNADLFSFRFF